MNSKKGVTEVMDNYSVACAISRFVTKRETQGIKTDAKDVSKLLRSSVKVANEYIAIAQNENMLVIGERGVLALGTYGAEYRDSNAFVEALEQVYEKRDNVERLRWFAEWQPQNETTSPPVVE